MLNKSHYLIQFRSSFGSVCTRILFLSPPNSVQNRSNLIKKVQIWCFFLISLYTNPIPESAKNRISNCSDETLKTQFLRAWRPKPGQMSNTEVMSPDRQDRQTDRTDRQTNILFLRLTTQWALRAIIAPKALYVGDVPDKGPEFLKPAKNTNCTKVDEFSREYELSPVESE